MKGLALLMGLALMLSCSKAPGSVTITQLSGEDLVSFGSRAGAEIHAACRAQHTDTMTVLYVFANGSIWQGQRAC